MSQMIAEVILPVSFCDSLSYAVPDEMMGQIAPGCRVSVPLRGKQKQVGVVFGFRAMQEENYQLKEIAELIDAKPIMTEQQLQFWKWLASYYACKTGEVMMAALPTGLKSEDAYKPKFESVLRLSESYCRPENLESLMASLQTKAKKQWQVLQIFLSQKDFLSQCDFSDIRLRKSDFLQNEEVSPAALKALIDKQIFIVEQEEVSRLKPLQADATGEICFSPAQKKAYDEIYQSWETKEICLLHGVTSSGKTEIYTQLIKEALAKNKQVLYLLPEIGPRGGCSVL